MDESPTTSPRPLPEIDELTAPFWASARAHALRVQRCVACERYQFPPERFCVHCGGPELTWTPVAGDATLYSWTAAHPPVLPAFQDRVPVPVAAVELAEGVRMISTVVDVPLEDWEIGMPLVLDYEDVDDEIALPVFRGA